MKQVANDDNNVMSVYTKTSELNTAAGGAIYIVASLSAILFACFLVAQRLLTAAQADTVATASLLQLGAVAVSVLAFVVFALVDAHPLRFPWLVILSLVGALIAALSVYIMPSSSSLGVLQGSTLGFDVSSATTAGLGNTVGAAAILAIAAAAAAGMDYATGNMRADRTGAVVSLAACSAIVGSGVLYVLIQLNQVYGIAAAAGGAVAIMATLFASSWAGARLANYIGGYRGTKRPAADASVELAAEQTKTVVSVCMVAAVLLPLYVVYSGKIETNGTWDESKRLQLIVVCTALASLLPAVSLFAAFGLVVRANAPSLYTFVATCVLAVAVYTAGILIPWTGGLIWLAILAALASLANMVIQQRDGGERKLSVILMLAAGVAVSQMLDNKFIALAPIALVAFALFVTGRSITPAAIVAGVVLWSIADNATTTNVDQSSPSPPPIDPAVLIGRTCMIMAAVTLVLTQLFYIASDVLPTILQGLSIFGVTETKIARGFGAMILVAMLSIQTRDITRFLLTASTK